MPKDQDLHQLAPTDNPSDKKKQVILIQPADVDMSCPTIKINISATI